MIKSFRHKGLEQLFLTGKKAGVQPHHAERLRLILAALDDATRPEDLASPRLGLHKLSGNLAGFWAVRVSGNWRVIFRFEGADAAAVDYLDYH
ncbi:MAG: type II toxin-antitoxin system RelE/ParE family toxin [Burkholderiales bacterium]